MWEHEMYEGFEYYQDRPFFYSFPGDVSSISSVLYPISCYGVDVIKSCAMYGLAAYAVRQGGSKPSVPRLFCSSYGPTSPITLLSKYLRMILYTRNA